MATKSLELNVLFDEITESGNKGTFYSPTIGKRVWYHNWECT